MKLKNTNLKNISAKQSATDALKLNKVIQKIAEATGGFTVNKIANRNMKASGNSLQNNSETITNKHENKEIPKESFRSPEEWQKLIDDLRLL